MRRMALVALAQVAEQPEVFTPEASRALKQLGLVLLPTLLMLVLIFRRGR